VILVHVCDRARFGFDQIFRVRNIGDHIRGGEIGGAGEAGIKVPTRSAIARKQNP
jgi:hypothetical protein